MVRYLMIGLLLTGSILWQSVPAPAQVKPQVTVVSPEKSTESKIRDFKEIAPDAQAIPGFLKLHRKKDSLYLEATSSDLNTDFIVIVSIAKGIGAPPLLAGWTWDFGEDLIWQFRKDGDRIQIVRRNFRHQAKSGTPEAKAISIAFTDSIIYSLPIIAKGPGGGDIVDITSIFMSDFPMISSKALPGFSFARDRSSWAKIKGFPNNTELEVAATYSGSASSRSILAENVMDPRGVSVNVHYSISKLPNEGYQPRLADERVGYFNTVIKNYSVNQDDNNFIRYINRWNLKKSESNAEVSLAKKPIIFWLEKTTPLEYRKPIRDGILEWNKAFEKAGYYNAIEVRQQEDNDTWDPEDINYNTIRWSAVNLGFSIGPSRVNPINGEILDADVILDVGFIKSWNRQFELYSPKELLQQLSGPFVRTKKTNNMNLDPNYSLDNFTMEDLPIKPRINESLFFSSQMGLAMTFFDVMTSYELYGPTDPEFLGDFQVDETVAADQTAKEPPKVQDPKKDEKKPEVPQNVKKEEPKKEPTKPEAKKEPVKPEVKKDAGNKPEAKKEPVKPEVKKDAGNKPEAKKEPVKPEAKKDAGNKPEAKKADPPKVEDTKKAEVKKEETPKTPEQIKEEKAKKEAEILKKEKEAKKKLINQGLKWMTTHEVGHTLGLRHNFKQSTLYSLDEINKMSTSSEYGYAGSIMEYMPVNIMPKGMSQGDYYPTKLGRYDYWVIEYGYRDFGKGTDAEVEDLKKIAEQQSRREYNYATDEDCYNMTEDPLINTFDLGRDPLEYAKVRMKLVKEIFAGLNDRVIKKGESYGKLATRFNMLMGHQGNMASIALKYIGGIHVNRDFKGDQGERPPFQLVSSKEQRMAMQFLNQEFFGVNSFKIPTGLYNYLAPNRWRHWGSTISSRYDMDVHELILSWQGAIMDELFSSIRLSHLDDALLKTPYDKELFTTAEMLESMTKAIFAELDGINDKGTYNFQKQAVSSVRRNLQQVYVGRLTGALSGNSSGGILILLNSYHTGMPSISPDFSNLARLELLGIQKRIAAIMDNGNIKLDAQTKAHFINMANEIETTIKAIKVK